MSTQERVGVLGGGQLGRMMAQAASRLGVSLTVLDPGGLASPAGMVSGQAITGSFTDAAKVRELAERCDVLTVEIEHVDAAVLAEIEAEGKVRVHPAPSTITVLHSSWRLSSMRAWEPTLCCDARCRHSAKIAFAETRRASTHASSNTESSTSTPCWSMTLSDRKSVV